eukprot:2526154-Rhodomonas_salina.4
MLVPGVTLRMLQSTVDRDELAKCALMLGQINPKNQQIWYRLYCKDIRFPRKCTGKPAMKPPSFVTALSNKPHFDRI